VAQLSGGTCGSCGGGLGADARFCPGCGAAVPKFCGMCGALRTSQARFCPECGFGFGDGSSAALTAPPAAPVSAPPIPVPVAPAPGARSPRRPIPPVALALAAVVVLVAGALGSGIVKLPGAANGTGTGEPAAPSGPVQSPPPIDNLATPAQGTLTLADSSAVQAIPLDANGASTTVSAPGQPWDGLKIDIPAGAWSGSTLKITAQQIKGSTFGDLITPISPLYTVSGGEGMAPTPVTIKIPATIPADSFAMGFFYDAATGHLEGMPLLAEDATSLTVATEHFSGYFGSLVNRALLPKTIDSGFRPGKDDWQFQNHGSYIFPSGNCSGQTLTEAWYYLERRLKNDGSPLYGLFDNDGGVKTPNLWQDDSKGYRLASVAQVQSEYGDKNNATAKWFGSWWQEHADDLQYNAFRYAMAVTGEPQLVNLFTDTVGHAMLVYRVAPSGLFVADPNYPGGYRLIPYDSSTSTFGSFLTAANATDIAEGKGINFTMFIYAAMTAFVDWPTLAADWAAFDAGTIGDSLFPAYRLEAMDANNKWVPLVDGFRTANPALPVRVVDTQHKGVANMSIYFGTSDELIRAQAVQTSIDLEEGSNPLGFLIQGNKPGDPLSWIDFVRLTVIVGPAVSPTIAAGRWHKNKTVPLKGTDGSTDGEVTDRNMEDGSTPTAQWGPPPDDVSPGGDWTTELTVTANATLSVYCDYYIGSEAHHQEWIITSPGTKTLTFTFPAYASNVEFNGFVVKATAGDVSDTWTYYYQWTH
jgi:hypothetical protein